MVMVMVMTMCAHSFDHRQCVSLREEILGVLVLEVESCQGKKVQLCLRVTMLATTVPV